MFLCVALRLDVLLYIRHPSLTSAQITSIFIKDIFCLQLILKLQIRLQPILKFVEI